MHPENPGNTPAFLAKLWKMVNDPLTDSLIKWGASGYSFIIPNQAKFWYELLPVYYKHNNMSSFIRQLNMYGFHKLSALENSSDEMQFSHPYFVKGQPELLRLIKRQVRKGEVPSAGENSKLDLNKVLNDVKQLKGRQVSLDSQLKNMKNENALLWREIAILRQKHMKQQKIVNKLIQFLVTLVQPGRRTVGVKRGYQLMLNESPGKRKKNSDLEKASEGAVIHELDDFDSNLNVEQNEDTTVESELTENAANMFEHNPTTSNNMKVATRDNGATDIINKLLNPNSDLNSHVESTEQEIGQIKDILSSLDANALLSLFSDDVLLDSNLNFEDKNEDSDDAADPLISAQVVPYENNFDISELLGDSLDEDIANHPFDIALSSVNTHILNEEESEDK